MREKKYAKWLLRCSGWLLGGYFLVEVKVASRVILVIPENTTKIIKKILEIK